jgi:DNA-binding NtrC family response regulator
MANDTTIQHGKRPGKPLPPVGTVLQRALTHVAEADCPVLLVGEHGVGKSLLAAHIHALSHRPHDIYTEIHCKDADAQILQTALASRGTVYLAEVSELSLPLQDLVVNYFLLNEKEQSSRLICGTSHELWEEINARHMQEDFFYLISAVSLRIPPLRCRKSELLTIADSLLTQYSQQFDRPKPVLQQEIIEYLMEHSWPENLLELQTAIKTLVAIGDQSISLAALKASTPASKPNGHRKPFSLKEATRAASIQIERQLISEVLVSTGGNRKRAADELGISYKALLYKLKQAEEQGQFTCSKNGVAS